MTEPDREIPSALEAVFAGPQVRAILEEQPIRSVL